MEVAMRLDIERNRLKATDDLIQRDEAAIGELRLRVMRLSALGQATAGAADCLSTLEATLHKHYLHRQMIADEIVRIQSVMTTD
jgi:hypothetical protein